MNDGKMSCKTASCCLNLNLWQLSETEKVIRQFCGAKLIFGVVLLKTLELPQGRTYPLCLEWLDGKHRGSEFMLQFNTLESFPLSESLSLSLNFLALWIYIRSLMLFQCIFSGVWCLLSCFYRYVFNERKSCLPLRRLQSFHEHWIATKCKVSSFFRFVVVTCVTETSISIRRCKYLLKNILAPLFQGYILLQFFLFYQRIASPTLYAECL